jgi:hypothetical protein
LWNIDCGISNLQSKPNFEIVGRSREKVRLASACLRVAASAEARAFLISPKKRFSQQTANGFASGRSDTFSLTDSRNFNFLGSKVRMSAHALFWIWSRYAAEP